MTDLEMNWVLSTPALLGVAARQAKVTLHNVTVEALIGFGKAEDGGFGISADLHINIPGFEQKQAEEQKKQAEIAEMQQLLSGV